MTHTKVLIDVTYVCPECKSEQIYNTWQWSDDPTTRSLLCDFCQPPGTFYTSTTPPWISESQRIKDSIRKTDPAAETRAAEVMQQVKEREMRHSAHARAWEASRKAEVVKYKPTWVKRGRNVKELKDI